MTDSQFTWFVFAAMVTSTLGVAVGITIGHFLIRWIERSLAHWHSLRSLRRYEESVRRAAAEGGFVK